MSSKKYSDLKIVWYPEKLNSFLEEKVTSPISVRIKPTNKCNHHCFYCIYNPEYSKMHLTSNKKDELPKKKIIQVIDDLKDMEVKSIIFSGGGEPLVYPYINESLSKTLENKIAFAMITNGQKLEGKSAELLSESEWMRISLDYYTPEMFKRNRGGNSDMFYKLKENIKRFAKIKKSECDLGVNCIIHENNNNLVYELAKFCKDLGIETIRFSPVWNPDFINYHRDSKERVMEQIEKSKQELEGNNFEIYESYTSEFESGGFSQRDYNRCYWMQVVPVIGADGNVYTCHNKAYDESGLIGSIRKRSFRDLWFSKETAEKFKNFSPLEECKHQCSSEGRNKKIIEILNCVKGYNFP